MSRPAIIIEDLSKLYRIGAKARRNVSFRESLLEAISSRFQRGRGTDRDLAQEGETFWALRGISLEIRRGEVVGLIGRNGSGKSTLLKIISRITEPTEGSVRIRGRLASLLEVGTGFHPELSGRENVYLNGSILGMTRAEISHKFDQIVAFAEVERFLDTPVKHYSSGMYVRLAFAVAAHLETQILLVDEVLAVGDAAFQKKCLGRISEVTTEGRTVIFVTHYMPTVQNLCSRCIFLDQGTLKMDGKTDDVLLAYSRAASGSGTTVESLVDHCGRTSHSIPSMTQVRIMRDDGNECIQMGDNVLIEVSFETKEPISDLTFGIQVKNNMQSPVFGINTNVIPNVRLKSSMQKGTVSCLLKQPPLMPGSYIIDLYFGAYGQNFDTIMDACQFEILTADIFGSGKIPPSTSGSIYWPATWSVKEEKLALDEAKL